MSESVKAPIISNTCCMNVVGLVMKNSLNLTSCNIVNFYRVLAHDLKVLVPDSSYLTHSNINTSLWPHWDYCPLRSKDVICQCAQHLYRQYTGQLSKICVVPLHFCFVYKANNINNEQLLLPQQQVLVTQSHLTYSCSPMTTCSYIKLRPSHGDQLCKM